MRKKFPLIIAASVLMASVTGCGRFEEQDSKPESQPSMRSESESGAGSATSSAVLDHGYDTGTYVTSPQSWTQPTEHDLSQAEVLRYADHMVLPHEVDPEIDLRGAQGAALFIDDLHWFLDEELIEAMRPFETDFVAGRGFRGTQLSGERNATHALIRFRNPQVAHQAAAAMVQMDRTQSRPHAAGPGFRKRYPDTQRCKPHGWGRCSQG